MTKAKKKRTKRKHVTAYQKATAQIDVVGQRECMLAYASVGLALSRYYGKGKRAITKVFYTTQAVWNDCAETQAKSMIMMCFEETGIEVRNAEGKSWEDLPYLNGSFPKLSNAEAVYMRYQQQKWIAPQIIACFLIAMHRNYGFGFERCARFYSLVQDIEAEHGMDGQKARVACLAETGIDVYDIYTTPREEKELV